MQKTSILVITGIIFFVGCQKPAGKSSGNLLSVDFKKDQVLRYSFSSDRDIVVYWEPEKRFDAKSMDKSNEKFEIVMSYKPVEVTDEGLATVQATCEKVSIYRNPDRRQGADAATNFQGKTFTLKVSANGKIEDYSELQKLIEDTGKKAFRPDTGLGRIKDPDMINDFIATQWFLWDSTSSIIKPSEGVEMGQSWKSGLSIPGPILFRKGLDVTYALSEIRPGEKGRIAVIRSKYAPLEEVPASGPMPYSGTFQMSGKFGFLGNYHMLSVTGSGEEFFNIDLGRTEKINQQYQIEFEASPPFGINIKPRIILRQISGMKLLADEKKEENTAQKK